MMQVLSVAAEAYPLVKTGGLGDVVGALPGALADHGVTVTTLLPGYPAVRDHIESLRTRLMRAQDASRGRGPLQLK